jgi:hypothetical protein
MTMPDDPIVEEVRRIKEAHAARYNYDIRAMAKALREQQQRSGHKIVSLPRRHVRAQQG